MYTEKDTIRSMYDESVKSNEGCIGIIKEESLTEKFRKPEYQLVRIKGGFGATPTAIGRKVVITFCYDGETTSWVRENFIGIANEEVTKIAEELERKRENEQDI